MRTLTGTCGMAVAAPLCAILIAACGASGQKPGPDDTVDALPCATSHSIVDLSDSRGLLTVNDVWSSARQSGHSGYITSFQPSSCGSSGNAFLSPQCQIGFPWLPHAASDAALATQGVVRLRHVDLRNTSASREERIQETVLEFRSPDTQGMATIRQAAQQCAGSSWKASPDWNLLTVTGGNFTALSTFGDKMVVVEFSDKAAVTDVNLVLDRSEERLAESTK